MNNLKIQYMKKLIAVFLLACMWYLFQVSSGCSEDPDDGRYFGDGNSCLMNVPEPDFTTSKTEYFVGEPVAFTYTGTRGEVFGGTPSPNKMTVSFKWSFPGTNAGNAISLENPVVTYIAAGTYGVSVTVKNRCYSGRAVKAEYITIKAK